MASCKRVKKPTPGKKRAVAKSKAFKTMFGVVKSRKK